MTQDAQSVTQADELAISNCHNNHDLAVYWRQEAMKARHRLASQPTSADDAVAYLYHSSLTGEKKLRGEWERIETRHRPDDFAEYPLCFAAHAKSAPRTTEPGDAEVRSDFLAQLRQVNSDRYEAWITTSEPLMLCEYCGRDEGGANAAGSTHCNAPFDRKEHSFTKSHPYLTSEVRADAGIMFDAVELGGEVGELLNVVKKLEREDRGWRGSRAAADDFADECADVLICLDKLARRRGVDLAEATARKFNATSDKVGLPHKLALATPSGRAQGEWRPSAWLYEIPGTGVWRLYRSRYISPQAVAEGWTETPLYTAPPAQDQGDGL